MNYKTNFFILFLLFSISFQFIACKKQPIQCNGNCVDFNINGKILVKTSGLGLNNIPINVNWFSSGSCLLCSSYKVVSGKTSADGSFNFNVQLDTSYFQDYKLILQIPADSNYISLDNMGGINFMGEARLYNFIPNGFQQLKFELYPKIHLKIRLHRIQNDAFTYFSVEHKFVDSFLYSDFVILGQQSATDSTKIVETSADVFTKITSKKTTIGGQTSQRIDSLICTINGNNVIDINY